MESINTKYYKLLFQANQSSNAVDMYDLQSTNPISVNEFKQLQKQDCLDNLLFIEFVVEHADELQELMFKSLND